MSIFECLSKEAYKKCFQWPAEAKTDFLCLDSVSQLLTTYTVCVALILAQYRFSTLNVKIKIVCINSNSIIIIISSIYYPFFTPFP